MHRGEVRLQPESRKVEGYAIVFNQLSEDLGGFREKILPEAMNGVLERSDVFALLNHSMQRGILARFRNGGGSLSLTVDSVGLRYEFDAPETPLGDELLSYLKRGEIDSSSFGFTCHDDKWERVGEEYVRTILQFDDIFEVSPVFSPAYVQTTCNRRGLDTLQSEEKEALEAEQRKLDEAQRVAFGKYIADLKSEIEDK